MLCVLREAVLWLVTGHVVVETTIVEVCTEVVGDAQVDLLDGHMVSVVHEVAYTVDTVCGTGLVVIGRVDDGMV